MKIGRKNIQNRIIIWFRNRIFKIKVQWPLLENKLQLVI